VLIGAMAVSPKPTSLVPTAMAEVTGWPCPTEWS
jgi:hypothetical protein